LSQTVYCTIASANYMPQIMALKESLLRHNPGARFEILLCEHPAVVRELSAELHQEFYRPDNIGCPDWLHMAFYYDCMEYNTALKPFFLQQLFAEGADRVVYIDPDIAVYGSMAELEKLLDEHPLVLTPHICRPLEDDGLRPPLTQIHVVGQFNLGFGAFRRTPEVEEVLRWWANRCLRDCISDLPAGIFVDQSWAAFFVSFVPDAKVLRSEAYNMAYWNVFQRSLWRDGDTWMTNDGPLVFFHYSGFTKNEIELVSRHQNRVRAEPGTPLHTLLSSYAELMVNSPYKSLEKFPYSFARFRDNSPITQVLRRRFRAMSDVERRLITNPFAERALLEGMQVVVGLDGTTRELEHLRHEVERLRHEVGQLRSDNERMRGGQPRELRYRAADALNNLVKQRVPGLHGPAKRLVDMAKDVRRLARKGVRA